LIDLAIDVVDHILDNARHEGHFSVAHERGRDLCTSLYAYLAAIYIVQIKHEIQHL
jgi:hypothetical protein